MNTVRNPLSTYPPSAQYKGTRYPRRTLTRAVGGRFGSGRSSTTLLGWFIAATLLFSLILLPFILLTGTYVIYTVQGHIFPGVMVGPIKAGDLTRDQLASKIDASWNQQPRISLNDGQQTWAVTPAEFGLRVDPQATAERAFAIGRGNRGLAELIWMLRFKPQPVEPVVTFDPQAAHAGLTRLSASIGIPTHEATLRLENGQWIAIPGQNGTSLLIEPTLQAIAANPSAVLKSAILQVVMQPVAPRVSDLTPALSQLSAALDQPLSMQAYDPITDQWTRWQIDRQTLAIWLNVSAQDGQVDFTLDGAQLAAYMNQWQASLGDNQTLEPFTPPDDLTQRWQTGQPVTVLIRHTASEYTVEAGDTLTRISFKVGMPYWKIQQANPNIDANSLREGQVLSIPSPNEMLPLPVVLNKRIVINITQQHMWTYENGVQRSEHIISTGIDKSPTIPGIYQIRTHDLNAYASVWDLYMPHFMGIYEGWPGFMNGIHGLPTLSNGTRLWDGYLGRKVSYGCIILSLAEAEDLYNWAEEGVIVEIQP